MTGRIQSIQDLEMQSYPRFFSKYTMSPQGNWITKADSDISTSTSGIKNDIFGRSVWIQLNQEANAFGIMPKYGWSKTGWRVLSANAGSDNVGGISEGGSLPDTVTPTRNEISTDPKEVVHSFGVSTRMDALATTEDDNIGDLQSDRQYWAVRHKDQINRMLLTDFDTLASNNFESIDRVTASNSEQSGVSATSGDEDIYGIDRSGNSWADAVSLHNSNVDRSLTDKLLRDLRTDTRKNGANSTFWLTGYDTYSAMQGLYSDQVRYNVLGESTVKVGVNGVQTKDGIGVGIDVATLYGKPLFDSKDVPTDTISRVYLLDASNPEGYERPRLGMSILKPTQYLESRDLIALQALRYEAAYYSAGELIATFLAAQGKLRDLQT